MKKSPLFALFLFVASYVFSQESAIDKGIILIKGSSSTNISFIQGTPININVSGGYFFFNKIALGVDADLSFFDGGSDTNFRPFGRYYFNEKFYGGVGLFSYPNPIGSGKKLTANLEGGYVFFLNDFIALEPSINYPLIDHSYLSLHLGISIYY